MTFALGTATGKIEIDYDGSGVAKAEEDVAGLQKKTGRDATKAMNDLSNASLATGAAIAAGLAVGVNAAASFEQGMSAVQAVSGATGDEMDQLRDKALTLGKVTAFSAGESANAMEELAKAGLPVEDILNGAADATVALAAAGAVDMPTAAGIASAAMNAFQLEANEVVKVADLMAGAANTSATDVVGVGEAFKYVAPLAAASGVSIEDTTGAIAALAKAGISGSMAGTTLRAMLQNLNPASAAAADEMKKLGIITEDGSNQFFDAQGNTKSMAEISGILQNALSGLSDEQKSQALSTIFGARAMTGAIALANQGEKGFNELAGAIGEVSAEKVAETRMDNLKGSLEELSGSLETAGIAIGTILIPYVRKLVDFLTGLLNKFLSLDDGTQKIIIAVIGVVGAMALFIGIAIKVILIIGRIQATLVILRGTMIATWAAALGPITLVIAAIAALVGIFVLLYKKNEGFRNLVNAVWNGIKSVISAVVGWIMGVPGMLQGAWDAVKSAMSAVGSFFASIWQGIQDIVSAVVSVIATIISTYVNIWKTIITTALGVLLAIWQAFWGVFGGVLTAAFQLIVAIFRLFWTIIKGVTLLALMGIKAVVMTVMNAIAAFFRAVWNVIRGIFVAGGNAIKAVVMPIWNTIRAVTAAVWGVISGILKGSWASMSASANAGTRVIMNIITAIWNAIKAATSRVWGALVDIIKNKLDDAVEFITGIKDTIIDFFAGAGGWLYDAGKAIIQGLIDGIEAMIGRITDVINSVTDKVAKFLPGSPVKEGPLKVLNHGYAGQQIMKMLMDGIASQRWALEQQIGDVAAVVPAGIAPVAPGGGRVRGGDGGGKNKRLRIVDGRLRIENGEAWISGIAQEADDDDDDYDDTLGRMSR